MQNSHLFFFVVLPGVDPKDMQVVQCLWVCANHAIHAQFMAQSSLYNKRRLISLLRGAGTRFGTWFYAMHHALHLKQALLATIHQQKFLDLESAKKQSVRMAVQDIEDNKFWKCLYILLHSVIPALRALRFCNASRPVMDKIFFLSHRTTHAIEKSQEFLNNSNLFGALTMDSNLIAECNVILGSNDGDIRNEEADDVVFKETPPTEDKLSGKEDDDSNKGESVVTMLFRAAVCWNWCKRKTKIEHPYAIVDWALCVMEDICKDFRLRLKGAEHDAIESVVKCLHLPPCPNKSVDLSKTSSAEIVDTFWNEFKAFQCYMEPFHHPSWWAELQMYQVGDPTFDTRSILSPPHRCWGM
jgi:hypothetical protein